MKIYDLSKVVVGKTPSTKEKKYWDNSMIWVTQKDMSYDKRYIENSERKISKLAINNLKIPILPSDSVLVSTYGTIGYVQIAKIPLATNQNLMGLIPNNKLIFSGKYLYYLIKTNINLIKKLSNSSTINAINKEIFSNMDINIHSIKDQQHIVNTI